MKKLKITFLSFLLAVCFFSVSAQGQQVGTFNNRDGWRPGDSSSRTLTYFGSLKVSLEVRSSTNSGQAYYVVTFSNESGEDMVIGARVTDAEPDSTHFRMRIPAGASKRWGEHLPNGLTKVYVLVRNESD